MKMLLFFVLLVTATTPAIADSAKTAKLKRVMDSNVGRMSYDEALSRLGQPTRVFDGDKIFVAEWITVSKPSPRPSNQTINMSLLADEQKSGLLKIIEAAGERKKRENEIAASRTRGTKIIFSFDKETKILAYWNIVNF